MIKTFRGLMVDGGTDTINLHTNDGKTGYRIVSFGIIPKNPGGAVQDSVIQIFKVPQTTAVATVDFSDQTLLAVAVYSQHSTQYAAGLQHIIFDREIFNQDIYITHKDEAVGADCNYYIELEQISLDLNESTVATLQSIRNA